MALATVLIVEDNQPLCRAIKSLIRDLVSEFHECADGEQAIIAYRQHRPDWVLIDMTAGRLDGLAVARQIRAAFPRARLVMLTDFDDEALRAAAEQAGASNYILKENFLAVRSIIKQ